MTESRVATVRRPNVEYVQRMLGDLGVQVDGVIEGGTARVPSAAMYRLWDAAERQAADAAIGFRAGALVRASDFGAIGDVFEHAPTLGEALTELSRLVPLIGDHIGLVLVVNGARTTFELVMDDPSRLHPRAAEHIVSMVAFAVHSRLPEGQSFGLTMHWAHECPMPGTDYEQLLGMRVRFDAGWNGLSIDTDALRIARPGDPARLDEARRRAEQGLRARQASGLGSHVRELVANHLAAGRPVTEAAIARRLGLHPKSLSRQLVAQGTTFRVLVAGERLSRARRLLEAGRTVDDVARSVGYADASAFTRAFKRWTGSTPSAYVAGARRAPAPAPEPRP